MAITPWICVDGTAKFSLQKKEKKSGRSCKLFDEYVYNLVKIGIIIHMWLRHSNCCIQCSPFPNLI